MRDYWVFGYGSLIWRPGFRFAEAVPARLHGAHRALCVYSHVHRGTPERPGLVLGLDFGGACRGVAFRVSAGDWPETLDYLRAREQVTMVYREEFRPITLADGGRREVTAVTYVVDRRHQQYAGRLDLETQLHHVRAGHGQSGPNIEYVLNTLTHLQQLGISDAGLAVLGERLRALGPDGGKSV